MITPESRTLSTKGGKKYIIKTITPISTGIEALDRLIVRKDPERSKPGVDMPGIYMLGGGPGTGKTLMALTMAKKSCDSGALVVYLSIEETISELLQSSSLIGIDLKPCIESSKLAIVEYAPRRGLSVESPYILSQDSIEESGSIETALVDIVRSAMEEYPEFSHIVLVIDSMPALTSLMPNINKRELLRAIKSIVYLSHTAIARVISEANFTVEPYVSKGIIELHSIRTVEGLQRYMIIPKMRSRPHYTGPIPFDITSEGIKIYTPDSKEFEERIEKIKRYFTRT